MRSNSRRTLKWPNTCAMTCLEKEDLLIDGVGKYPDYNFYRVAGKQVAGKDKGEALNEAEPVDVRSLLP